MSDDRRHVNLEDRPVGEYVADVKVYDVLAPDVETTFTLTLDDLYALQLHTGNAIRSLQERQTLDALCGDCLQCGNTRMVHVERGGRTDWTEHCPKCWPKIEAWRARVGER